MYKTKLLNTNYFIDNEYLDKYCQLVTDNKATSKIKYQTQTHHILPRCYFKLLDLPVDHSHSNLVEFQHYDHALAHYYLCFCTTGELKYKLRCAFMFLVNSNRVPKETKEALGLIEEYAKLLLEISKEMSQHAHEYSEHKYINNGVKTKHVREEDLPAYLQAGWNLGALNGKKRIGSKCMTNGQHTVFAYNKEQVDYYLQLGYYFGRHYAPAAGHSQSESEREKRSKTMTGVHKNKIHINNGLTCKFVTAEEAVEYLDNGWVRGRLMKSMKNKK